MLTIAGSGVGEYDFSRVNLDLDQFDLILCDKNFDIDHPKVVQLDYKNIKLYIERKYKNHNLLYVVTGSPTFYSAGALIAKNLEDKSLVRMVENSSSKSYLLSKLFISDQNCSVISLHGRTQIDLENFLDKEYTFVLCDRYSVDRIKKALEYVDRYSLTIGYKLGFHDEVIDDISSLSFEEIESRYNLDKPYVLLIKREYEISTCSKDSEFDTERGMITKEYKRDLSLQNLDLKPNDILWDVGAGSGSCAIEAYKRYRVKSVLFEKNPTRIEHIKTNLKRHSVVDTTLYKGEAQDIIPTLTEAPNKVFIGGGGSDVIYKIPYIYGILKEDGVILISVVTLKHLISTLDIIKKSSLEYEVFSISLTTYKGELDLATPQRQMYQIKISKK
jgi:precorrin-6Y C5,15-methyltransferase (decarboxylating)